MKNNTVSSQNYYKEARRGILLPEGIPVFLIIASFTFLILAVIDIVRLLLGGGFNLESYPSNGSILLDPEIPLLFALLGSLFEMRKRFHLIKGSPFALISKENLVLGFGKASFAWSKTKSIRLEGDRKLTIIFAEEGKHKKRTCDLKGLSEKEDFISALRENCASSEIQYWESALTCLSRIDLFFSSLRRYPYN